MAKLRGFSVYLSFRAIDDLYNLLKELKSSRKTFNGLEEAWQAIKKKKEWLDGLPQSQKVMRTTYNDGREINS